MRWQIHPTLILAVMTLALFAGLPTAATAQTGPATGSRTIPPHPIRPDYSRIKAALDARAPAQGSAAPQVSGHRPTPGPNWQGQGATNYSPSDSTGAIGPTEYIELVNVSVGVYNRSGGLLSQSSQAAWTGIASASGDAVIEWSPHDNRFYAAMLYIGSDYELIYGFSKGSAPSASNSDWCFYHSTFGGRYGANLPDYPKLGDTADFILIGVNTFAGGSTYSGSDVAWVGKPPAGAISTCPSQSSLPTGVQEGLKNADGTDASTPNPAKQTDSSSTGYVVANEDPYATGLGTSTVLSVFTVSNAGGSPSFAPATTVVVPSYAYPLSAPQRGTTRTLDTLDARLMSAWAAPDSSRADAVALWTGHTVQASAGGLGAEFRWYEINPATGVLLQSNTVQSTSLYVFNGAISPDRNGTLHAFGSNAVMAFNTSSGSALPAAAMASVVGGVQSGIVTVAVSQAPDHDFTCTPVCRWGDYPGASPDPNATNTTGKVWATEMTNGKRGNPSWTTRNWAATP